jgi:hypothetical protein
VEFFFRAASIPGKVMDRPQISSIFEQKQTKDVISNIRYSDQANKDLKQTDFDRKERGSRGHS